MPETNPPEETRSVQQHGVRRSQYLKHIRRLQRQNAELAAMLAEERTLRRRAYAWYAKKLKSRVAWLIDAALLHWREASSHTEGLADRP